MPYSAGTRGATLQPRILTACGRLRGLDEVEEVSFHEACGFVAEWVGAVSVDAVPVAGGGGPQVDTGVGLVVAPAAAVGLDAVAEADHGSEVVDAGLPGWPTLVGVEVGVGVVDV